VKPEIRTASPRFDRRAIPPDAVEGQWICSDGHLIRRFDWKPCMDELRGSLLFLPGRSDFYEKYLETLDHWRRRGWYVTATDWRGQCGSGRLGLDELTGHVDDFAIWVDDFAELWQPWRASTKGPHVLVAHSMAGHITLRALAEKRVNPAATVLIAPMLGLLPGLGIVPLSWLYRFTRLIASLGDPRRPAWRGTERPVLSSLGRFARLTHDRDRYDDETWWRTTRPELVMGAPSWGWIVAALRSILLLRTPGFLESIDRPVLMLATRADRLVEFGAIEKAAARLPQGRLEVFGSEARHELLREQDSVRDRALQLIDEFLDRHVRDGD
jgi:lysophospholipase